MKSHKFKIKNFPALAEKTEDYWLREDRKRSLLLFHETAEFVPAYRDFLKKNNINHEDIKTWKDFLNVPFVDKKNYLREYPLKDLCWDGDLKKPMVFTSTSGSTGEPFYFPRGGDLDWQYSFIVEEFLKNSIKDDEPTLVIIGFGMGVWIGGLITYKAFQIAAGRNHVPISIITPGINKKEIFNSLKNLAPQFAHTVLVGYPPFVKDILDEAGEFGIDVKKLDIKLLFAAEAFTEKFRDYLAEKAGIKNTCLDTMNIYGSADIGAMACETPISILIRKLALKNDTLFKNVFGSINKTPTLTQFNPLFIKFESVDGKIILTANNRLPLIRYSIGDHGGVYTYSEMLSLLEKSGIDIEAEKKKTGIENISNKMPFVFVFERIDLSVTLYGLQIYPEIIRETILEEPFDKYLTGKLAMITKFNRKHDQYLEINIELKKNVENISGPLKKELLNRMLTNLRNKSSEFRELSDYLRKKAKPKILFWPSESAEYFSPGVKQRWVIKKT